MQTESELIPQTNTLSYGKIYRLTNKINGKMYHGQTTEEDINIRWNKYKKLYCKNQLKLYNALKKYGPENFLFEVIDTSSQNQLQLDDLEIKYINIYDTMNNGYNCMPGGKSSKLSEETKRKISNTLKGYKLSEETKKKISKALSGKIRGPSILKGTHRSEETKKKISQSKNGLLFSDIHKVNLSNAHRGKILSDKTKAKLSEIRKGKKKSIEHKKKISDSLKLRALNKLMNAHLKKIG